MPEQDWDTVVFDCDENDLEYHLDQHTREGWEPLAVATKTIVMIQYQVTMRRRIEHEAGG
jgi:hypothetical protein